MKKPKGKGAGRGGEGGSALSSRKQVDLEALRQKIAKHVGGRSLPMVKTATNEVVKTGNIAALKYLFELIGLYPPEGGAQAEEVESDDLARVLLERLDLERQNDGEVSQGTAGNASGSDSVE
jgi:hypothetical protein